MQKNKKNKNKKGYKHKIKLSEKLGWYGNQIFKKAKCTSAVIIYHTHYTDRIGKKLKIR